MIIRADLSLNLIEPYTRHSFIPEDRNSIIEEILWKVQKGTISRFEIPSVRGVPQARRHVRRGQGILRKLARALLG